MVSLLHRATINYYWRVATAPNCASDVVAVTFQRRINTKLAFHGSTLDIQACI